MKKFLTLLVSGGLFLFAGIGIADEHEGEADEANVATPMEMFACNYNKGKGPADLDAAVKKFNAWGDKKGIDDYSAWTLVPYYSSPEQEFDVLWLGGSEKAGPFIHRPTFCRLFQYDAPYAYTSGESHGDQPMAINKKRRGKQ